MADIDRYHTKSNSITSSNNNNNTTLKLFGFNISENGNDNNNNNISVDDSRKSPSGYSESETETRKYECQYCFREFANSQALGGHQNAHKKERQLLKRAQIQASRNLANSYVPTSMFSTFSSFPPHLLPPGAVPVPHHQSPSWFYTSHGRPPFFSGHGSGLHESLGLHARTSPEEWNGLAGEDGGPDRRNKGLGLDLHLSL